MSKKFNRYILGYAYSILSKYSLKLALIAVLLWLVVLLLSFYYTLVLRDFFNYLTGLVSETGIISSREKIIVFAIILVFVWLAKYIVGIFAEYFLRSTAINAIKGLSREFINKITYAKPRSLPEKGDVLGRFISDLNRVSELSGLIPSLIIQFARLVIGIVLLYVLNIYLLIASLAALPIYYIVFRISSRKLAEVSEKERKEFALLSSSIKNVIDYFLHIKLHPVTRSHLGSKTLSKINSWSQKLRRVIFYDVFFNQTFNNLYVGIRILVLVLGGFLITMGKADIGSVIAFSNAIFNVYEPVSNMSYMLAALGELKPYVERVEEILGVEVENEEEGIELRCVDEIIIKNVDVVDKGRRILSNVNAIFKKGEVYSVMGPTGSGKSTLLLTIVRYYEPQNGEVIINGIDYRKYKLRSLRERIVYLPQFPLVFRGSLRENICLNAPVSEEALQEALTVAKIDFVKDPNDIIDPEKLSDGQKQRIALARALIFKPDVLLFDEALNAVDEATEAYIMERLRDKVKNGQLKIVIVVSHRSSTLKYVDHVYTVENGYVKSV